MTATLARPRRQIVYKCTVSGRRTVPCAAWDDDEDQDFDDDEFSLPLSDDDPDWGFDDEEAEPEQGDFWFDDDDEEEAL